MQGIPENISNNNQDNLVSGWIKTFRSLKNHWLWPKSKPLTRVEAWLLILFEANHTEEKIEIEGEILICKRGQKLYSIGTWAKEFNWTNQKVRTFFNLLEKDGMIKTEGLRKTTRLTVCNYETYQASQQTDNEQITNRQRTDNEQITTIKELKNLIIKELKLETTFQKQKVSGKATQQKIDKSKFKYFDRVVALFDERFYNEEKWLDCYDKIIRIDKHEEYDILRVVEFFRADGNWWKDNGNFESLLKLRKRDKENNMFMDVFLARIDNKFKSSSNLHRKEDGKKDNY